MYIKTEHTQFIQDFYNRNADRLSEEDCKTFCALLDDLGARREEHNRIARETIAERRKTNKNYARGTKKGAKNNG